MHLQRLRPLGRVHRRLTHCLFEKMRGRRRALGLDRALSPQQETLGLRVGRRRELEAGAACREEVQHTYYYWPQVRGVGFGQGNTKTTTRVPQVERVRVSG